MKRDSILNHTALLLLFWSLFCLLALKLIHNENRNDVKIAAIEAAREALLKDLAVLHWNISHGGIYVPEQDRTSSSEASRNIPPSRLLTTSGARLILINFVDMIQQIQAQTHNAYADDVHATRLESLAPASSTDGWERKALLHLQKDGSAEIFEELDIAGEPYLYGMVPLPVEEKCLRCHLDWTDRIDDIRAGLSIRRSMQTYYQHMQSDFRKYLGGVLGFWGAGVLIILWSGHRLRRHDLARIKTAMALTESEQRFHELVNNIDGIVWELDLQTFCFTFVSKQAEVLFGYPLEDWSKPDFWINHLHPDDRSWAVDFCRTRTAAKADHAFEYRMLTRDGRAIWLRDLVSVKVIDDQPVLLRGVMVDITAAKQAEAEMLAARQEAEAASQAKTEFLANMSHELRTPLNGTLGMLQLLATTSLDTEQKEQLRLATRSSEILLKLINELLDLSQIEAGKMRLSREPFSLREACTFLQEFFTLSLRKKSLASLFECDPRCPAYVIGDEGRFRQVLLNLIGNAIKFTPEHGRVACRITCEPHSESRRARIAVTISDTGIGIEPERLVELFNPFVQGESCYRKQYRGAGLGLAIVKRLTDLMEGEVHVESQVGQGTTIKITLPLEAYTGLENDMPEPETPSASNLFCQENLRVLLAEDNKISRLTITRMLEQKGSRVTAVTNGLNALHALAEEDFDLVLMDIQMPVMDGVEAVRHIRAGNAGVRNPRIPVIALTAYAMPDEIRSFLDAGMDDCLTKPVYFKNLEKHLRQCLKQPTSRPNPA